jgi:hypothetical protein
LHSLTSTRNQQFEPPAASSPAKTLTGVQELSVQGKRSGIRRSFSFLTLGLIVLIAFGPVRTSFAETIHRCQAIFSAEAPQARTTVETIMTHHLNFTEQTRTMRHIDGFQFELITNIELQDLSVDRGKQDPDRFIRRANAAGKRYLDFIVEVTEAVIRAYKRRGWTEAFKHSLIRKARLNDMNSGYITARKDGHVVGNMRVTFSPYQVFINKRTGQVMGTTAFGLFPHEPNFTDWLKKGEVPPLPAELTLKVKLPRPGIMKIAQEEWISHALASAKVWGLSKEQLNILRAELEQYELAVGVLIEPSSFMIDPDGILNPKEATTVFANLIEGMSEIVGRYELRWPRSRFMNTDLRSGFALPAAVAGDKRIFLTYGDPLSLRFYRPLGYEPVGESPAARNGDQDWIILASTPAQYAAHIVKLNDRLRSGGVEAQRILEGLRAALLRTNERMLLTDTVQEHASPQDPEDRWFRDSTP